jgi:exportin-1
MLRFFSLMWMTVVDSCCEFLLQEFAGEDNQDLFMEEREAAIKQAQEEKRKIQMSVPGILGPHEIQEDMQD